MQDLRPPVGLLKQADPYEEQMAKQAVETGRYMCQRLSQRLKPHAMKGPPMPKREILFPFAAMFAPLAPQQHVMGDSPGLVSRCNHLPSCF